MMLNDYQNKIKWMYLLGYKPNQILNVIIREEIEISIMYLLIFGKDQFKVITGITKLLTKITEP